MRDRDALRATTALVATWLAVWLSLPGAALGTHHGQGVIDDVSIRISFQRAPVANVPPQVIAHLAMDDGEPIAGVEVEFAREVEFMGSRSISLGRSTTDANGDARIAISDVSEPSISVVARFAGDEYYNPSEQKAIVDLPPVGAAVDEPEAVPAPSLAVASSVMPPLLALSAAAVWVVLIGLGVFTVLAVRRGRQSVVQDREGRLKA